MLARLDALPRDTRDTLFLLAVIGWIMLPQFDHVPVWCSALAVGVLVWRGWLAVAAKPLPGRAWLLGLLFVAVAATAATYRTVLGRDAGVTLVIVLLALKTLELRAKRDTFVVFFLGFFSMLTNFFFSQSLPVAFAMLVALLGLLTALVNAHMPVGKPPLAQAARTAAWMALLGAPVMAVLFVLFPRFAPLWGTPGDAMTGRSGLSATMRVGNMASLALDETIAFRVKFDGAMPAQSALYFRGPVLSSFDGREWRPLLPRFGGIAPFMGPTQLEVSGEPVRYEVTLEPNNRPWLMTLDVARDAPQASGMETVMSGELVWIANRPVTDLLRYKAESYTRFRYGPRTNAAALPPEYVQLPFDSNPRTWQLAQQMRRDPALAQGGPPALVQAALDRLRTGGYTYTLDPGVYGADTADEFWFDRKEGFCEHIASAFVVLMRAMNIPARIVTGYQGGELNNVDGYWVVRQSDAHAWAEVWLAGRGWVRVDPTSAVAPGRIGALQRLAPPRSAIATAFGNVTPGLAQGLRSLWEAVNNTWNQRILNYTQSRQLNLLKDIGFASPSWEDLASVLIGLVVLVALGGAAWTVWDRREHDPWLRMLHRVRRRLAARGIDFTPAAPPRRIATAVTDRFGELGAPLARWLLKLEEQRYAPSSEASLRALQRELRHLPWPA